MTHLDGRRLRDVPLLWDERATRPAFRGRCTCAPTNGYCQRHGKQPALIDLEGRNCRGGFGTEELDEFIPGWRDELSLVMRLERELAEMRDEMLRIHNEKVDHFEARIAAERELAAAKQEIERLRTIDLKVDRFAEGMT